MGIKQAISNKFIKVGEKAADKIAQLSKLSPEQLELIDKKRQTYLLQKPDPTDTAAQELTGRLLGACGIEVYNAYLQKIEQLYLPIERDENNFNSDFNIKYFNITKWVTDKKENNIEKLVNVYQVCSNENCNIALIFNRTENECNVYMAVVNLLNSDSNDDANDYRQRICDAIKGNFPGASIKGNFDGVSIYDEKIGDGHLSFINEFDHHSIAAVSNIPAEKSEKFISQTIEKLLDGIVPSNPDEEYTLILLATPILDVDQRKLRLGELYSGLAPYSSWQTQFTFLENDSTNSNATFGLNVGATVGLQSGINKGTQNSQTITDGVSDSQSKTHQEGHSDAHQEGVNDSHQEGTNESNTKHPGQAVAAATNGIGGLLGTIGTAAMFVPGGQIIGAGLLVAAGITKTAGAVGGALIGDKTKGKSTSDSHGTSSSDTHTKNVSDSTTETHGTNHSEANTNGVYNGVNKGINAAANFGANFARSSSVTATVGKNEGITQSYTNYNIKHSLELLEEQMKRMEESSALGMWDFGAYVISKSHIIANNVAHSYLALTQGEKSYLSNGAINLWRGDVDETEASAKEIYKYLRDFHHPEFVLNEAIVDEAPFFYVYPTVVTPTTALSGKELAYSLNFPAKSVSGLPVLECASFGRNISTYDLPTNQGALLNLGQIFHMNHKENLTVRLDANSLTSHVFITGSTGSGKSNTVYQLLDEASKIKDESNLNKIHFLVIEPAKGEYKHIFVNRDDVEVYGTNPNETQLLQINPFSFPKNIHILEHLDRLLEIFNVCWPMYAAMPAVLKEAIEKSYEDAGWNLTESTNPNGDLYPTFKDVAQNIKIIIDTSEYDTDNKGAYKGSLLTRLKTLTNGLNGQIFTTMGLEDSKLFDENVIIDLSRVGSQETKSLLMGVLVLKLQEYRMTQGGMKDLNHITVLEEAHNLLKRTSTEQSAESANLAGKSVEMLTNAIAEMRTYGEGFIIADQAPALLDMAVIRNTNTKIIMRLPDLGDRELVGRAANLNDDQITELAKLPRGVAAVYQNEWVEAVLCNIKYFEKSDKKYKCPPSSDTQNNDELNKKRIHVASLLSRGEKLSTVDSRKELDSVNISFLAKAIAIEYLQNPPSEPRMTKLAPVMAALFPRAYEATKNTYVMNPDNPAMWSNDIVNALNREHYWIDKQNMDQVQRDIVQALITQYVFNEIHQGAKLEAWSEWTKHNGF